MRVRQPGVHQRGAAIDGPRCELDRGRLAHFFQPRLFDSNLQEKSLDLEEQIRCRGASPITVLTVGLIGPHVNYGIVHVALMVRDGLRIAVSRAKEFARKHAKAVEPMIGRFTAGTSSSRCNSSTCAGRSFWDASVPCGRAVAGQWTQGFLNISEALRTQ